jgi:hypothetical protein
MTLTLSKLRRFCVDIAGVVSVAASSVVDCGLILRRFVVTGGNSGIGFQAAKELARNNAHVVLTARDAGRGDE